MLSDAIKRFNRAIERCVLVLYISHGGLRISVTEKKRNRFQRNALLLHPECGSMAEIFEADTRHSRGPASAHERLRNVSTRNRLASENPAVCRVASTRTLHGTLRQFIQRNFPFRLALRHTK